MRGANLTKLTSREPCRQHAFDFEIVVSVGARLSLLERLAYAAKATGNRDNLMGLYLSGTEETDGRRRGGTAAEEGDGGGREQSKRSSEGQFAGRD